jgi:putative tributyrin esterase
MEILTRTSWSRVIGRQKSMTIALPPGYSARSAPYSVIYLLHGFGGNRQTWLKCSNLVAAVGMARTIAVMPESGRYWFINDFCGRRYEDYLVNEVIQSVDETFNTAACRNGRAIAGFSMGGAAAFYQSFRHSGVFSVACSNSGAFDAPRRVGDPYRLLRSSASFAIPSTRDHERVWGPVGSAVRRTYDPGNILSLANPGFPLSLYFDVGLTDFPRVIEMNRNMRDRLSARHIKHDYAERPGGHDLVFVDNGLLGIFRFAHEHLRPG